MSFRISVCLDVDDVQSYGPETISIKNVDCAFPPGTYRFSIHHNGGSSNIPESGATVKVYQGDALMGTFSPPAVGNAVMGDGCALRMFRIDVNAAGDVSYSSAGEYYGPVTPPNVD